MSESKIYTIPDGNNSLDPNLMLALSQNGGFGNNGSWMWMMFMWILFPWIFGGNGFGNGINGGGAGFLANQLNNDAGRDLLLQAINGTADALGQLANLLNTSVSNIQNGVNQIQAAIQSVGNQVGLTGQQVINSIQNGNASLSQQLCNCCCENRLAVANQTNALQSQAASNYSGLQATLAANHAASTLQEAQNQAASQLQLAQNQAATQLQMAQIESADQLAVCQQTNTLTNQSDRNTNNILNAIAGQNTLITKEFCDLKERELQNKINTQGDIITQLRNQISNDNQTILFNKAISALDDKIDAIAARQPNTVPVAWPNIVAANATPYVGPNYSGLYNGNGFGNNIVF